MAKGKGWTPVKRDCKNRYLYLLATDKRHARLLKRRAILDLGKYGSPIICGQTTHF
jgi:hypothetical protein